MKLIETDSDSGVGIYQLTDDPRPTDNIYGEQPYGSADGSRITVRHYAEGGLDGALTILDLESGEPVHVIEGTPRFPAFHAWGSRLYNQEIENGSLILRCWDYGTFEREDVLRLPQDLSVSYGTVTPDGHFYAVSIRREDGSSFVLSYDLEDDSQCVLIDSTERYFKHEQFALDGSNRLLIQANSQDVTTVYLGVLTPDREGVEWFPADRPHTPRPTGHEAWIGRTGGVFFSTGVDSENDTNIWTASLTEDSPAPASSQPIRLSHVSVSRCGMYWIGDVTREDGIPIFIASFVNGVPKKLFYSRTVHDDKQWSHTHPYLTADNGWLIFTSNRSGSPQVYGARIPEDILQNL